jgi:putative hydrolase of the HAD superfamily
MSRRPSALIIDYTGVITVPLSMGGRPRSEPGDAASPQSSVDRLRAMMSHELHNPDPDALWNRLERGEAPVSELVERIEEIVPGAGVFFSGESATTLMASLEVRADVVERIRGWRGRGIPLALLTNNVAEWRPHWTAKLDAAGGLSLFDVVIDSSEVGMRKPEERIYHHTVGALNERLGLRLGPGDCLFVDDFEQNIAGAEAVGMATLLATSDDAHWELLDSLF